MKFSIITVNYNHREGLIKTIQSVINQTYTDYEYIIIDGGSTDGSVEVIKEYSDRITYWVSERDKGIYNGMNKGILKAHGEYINFMNSGDTFFDEKTLSMVNHLMNNNDIIVGKDHNEDPKSHKTFQTILPKRISMVTFYLQTFPHQSTFIRRHLFYGSLYDETLKIVSDWKFFMNKVVYENASVQILQFPICNREQGGLSAFASKTLEERNQVLKNSLPVGILKDYQTLNYLDRSTIYKLFDLIEKKNARKVLTLFIKIANIFYGNNQ